MAGKCAVEFTSIASRGVTVVARLGTDHIPIATELDTEAVVGALALPFSRSVITNFDTGLHDTVAADSRNARRQTGISIRSVAIVTFLASRDIESPVATNSLSAVIIAGGGLGAVVACFRVLENRIAADAFNDRPGDIRPVIAAGSHPDAPKSQSEVEESTHKDGVAHAGHEISCFKADREVNDIPSASLLLAHARSGIGYGSKPVVPGRDAAKAARQQQAARQEAFAQILKLDGDPTKETSSAAAGRARTAVALALHRRALIVAGREDHFVTPRSSFYAGEASPQQVSAYLDFVDVARKLTRTAIEAGATAEQLEGIYQRLSPVAYNAVPHRVVPALFGDGSTTLESKELVAEMRDVIRALTAVSEGSQR